VCEKDLKILSIFFSCLVIDIAMDTVGKVYVLAGVANIGGLLMFNRFYTHSTALAGILLQLIYKLSYSVIADANLLFVVVYLYSHGPVCVLDGKSNAHQSVGISLYWNRLVLD
jgi:hypothetical protein